MFVNILQPVQHVSIQHFQGGYTPTTTRLNNSNYVAEIQSTSIPDEQLVAGYIILCRRIHIAVLVVVSGDMYQST